MRNLENLLQKCFFKLSSGDLLKICRRIEIKKVFFKKYNNSLSYLSKEEEKRIFGLWLNLSLSGIFFREIFKEFKKKITKKKLSNILYNGGKKWCLKIQFFSSI